MFDKPCRCLASPLDSNTNTGPNRKHHASTSCANRHELVTGVPTLVQQHLSNTLYFQPFLLIIRVSLVISHVHSLMPESVSFFPTVAISEDREILGGRSLLRLSISHHVYTSDLEYLGLGNGLSQERHISSESLV